MTIGNLRCAIVLAATVVVLGPARASAASCESVAALTLPNTTITLARMVGVGGEGFTAFTLPSELKLPPEAVTRVMADVPAFCRVAATLRPSSDSDIKIEVWMPPGAWNGKFLGVGNGGWAGVISYPGLADAVRRGYAVASTDTGHTGIAGQASFAMGHPEKLVDFGYRAVREMTVTAKAIVRAFYDQGPRYAYWNGCSTGGKQGLTEAQRFPADYDGIVAGAPANYWTHLMAGLISISRATLTDKASYIPPAKFQVLHRAVLNACDARDGVTDSVLDDPRSCRFDPEVLACKAGEDGPECLTAPQIVAARKIYGPLANPRTGETIFPGLPLGSEPGWVAAAGGPEPFAIPASFFKYVVFENPNWDFRTLDFDRDVVRADEAVGAVLNAIDPNVKPFVDRGGKLLLYHGWSDNVITAQNTINYYESVKITLGARETDSAVRLFMAPGMGHCGGGQGPNTADWLTALERWVEKGQAPDAIVASHSTNGVVDRTRPLCRYPQVARYKGSGSTDEAANSVCAAP